jgi:hypothetical protein
MRTRKVPSTLKKAFAALSEKQKANLRWHARQQTNICCGMDYSSYIDQQGGG